MRIMIVDDEVIIRTGLANVIKWSELGMELLEPAASGEEALERLAKERPHILLTDIRMTGMTGLELAEAAKRLLPEIEVVILSGYDDFVYMQQAIRQGVSDYLLKTSRPEEIIKTVMKARQRIEEKRAAYSQDYFKNKEARNRLFERLIEEGGSAGLDHGLLQSSLPRLFGEAGTKDGLLQIWLVAAEGWNDSPATEELLLFAVENMLNDVLDCETLRQKKRVVVMIRAYRDRRRNLQDCRLAIQKVERLLKCTLFIALGKLVELPEQLAESFASAEHAFGYKGLIQDRVCDDADVRQRTGGKPLCSQEQERELHAILLEDDPVALKGWAMRFIQEQLDDPQMTRESLESSVQSAVISAHRWLERVRAATGSGPGSEEFADFRFKWDDAPKEALFQHLYAVMKLYHNRLSHGQSTHVQKAIAYIEVHLEGDVCLTQVAKHVHLHPGHLSEVFKKETGMTFGDYVMRQKIRRAMEILAVSPAKISEVAARVGYEDVKYFSQLFKKYTGKTPKDFREDASVRQ